MGLPSVEGVDELMAQEVPRGRVAGRRQNGHEPRLGPEPALRADERGWGGRISSDWSGLDGVLGGSLVNADDCGVAAIGTGHGLRQRRTETGRLVGQEKVEDRATETGKFVGQEKVEDRAPETGKFVGREMVEDSDARTQPTTHASGQPTTNTLATTHASGRVGA